MKISEMIDKLQQIKNEHGDLDIYEYADYSIHKYDSDFRPKAVKIYYQKWKDAEHMQGELTEGSLEEENEKLYDVDLNKPIKIGVVI